MSKRSKMFNPTPNRIRKKIERAKQKAARVILNTPEEYINQTFIIRVTFGKSLYMDFKVDNIDELKRIAKGDTDETPI